MPESKKTPDLRFAGFVDEWEQRKLRELAEFNPKSALPDNFEYVDLESVVGTNLVSHRTEMKESAPSRAQRLAREGDVFYQTVRPYQRNNYLFEFPRNNFVFSTGYAQMRPNIDSRFLFCRLQEERFVKAVLDRCTGTSYPAINANDLSEIEIEVPSNKDEQARLGATFKSLDHLLTLHQREYDKTVNIKKAMLEKMFPKNGSNVPEIRFEGFTGAWEEHKLEDVLDDLYNGQTPSRFHSEFWNGTICWLTSGELNRGMVHRTLEKITPEGRRNANLQLVPKGTFVMAITGLEAVGTRGNCAILNIDTTLNQSCMAVFPNKKLLDTYFLFQWYRRVGEEYGIQFTQGTKQQSYNAEVIKKLEIMLPKTEEQNRIAEFLFALDRLITLYQRELEKLQNIKKSLLENMFV